MLSLETTSGRAGEADALGSGIHARINGCQCHLSDAAGEQAEQEGECFHGGLFKGWKGAGCPPYGITPESSGRCAPACAGAGCECIQPSGDPVRGA